METRISDMNLRRCFKIAASLNKEQENAKNYRGNTLLLSAGAGSGKTYTLTQRIISRITDEKDPIDIDEMLVVTFTNAAASELLNKIEDAVTDCALCDTSNKRLLRQLAKLRHANISTISSFCFKIVKTHFEKLGLPPSVRMADEIESAIMKQRTVDSVLEEEYKNPDTDAPFYTVCELFSGSKDDENFASVLLYLYNTVYSEPQPEAYMHTAIEKLRELSECQDFFSTYYGSIIKEKFSEILDTAVYEFRELFEKIKDVPGLEPNIAVLSDSAELAESIKHYLNNYCYDEFVGFLSSVKFPSLSTKAKWQDEDLAQYIKDSKQEICDSINFFRKNNFSLDSDSIRKTADDSIYALTELFSLISKIHEKYTDEKLNRGIIDFTDCESYAFRLLTDSYDSVTDKLVPSEIARLYSDSFKEIYIDEYQDINKIQDLIFRSLCRRHDNGHESNRFMVGDKKQSIYGFRGSRPELFEKYLTNSLPLSEDTDSLCEHKEYLSNNYRCSKNIVDFVNFVFERIMQESYPAEERLVFSKKPEENCDFPCEVLLYDKRSGEEADYYGSEVKLAAKRINEIISEGKYSYRDIAVIIRKSKGIAEKYSRYFEKCGIPVRSELNENFFECPEILLCLCILNAVDNPLRDIYVTGAMRSEIFGFTDDDLVEIELYTKNDKNEYSLMWHKVGAIADDENSENTALSEKCRRFRDTVNSLRKESIGMQSDKFLLLMYSKLHLYNVVSGKGFNTYSERGKVRRANLDILYDISRKFESSSYRGLSAFIDYLLERASDPGKTLSASETDSDDAVKIMTVHHSKGLQFPVCFVCGLSSKFNFIDSNSNLIANSNGCVAFKLKDLKNFTSCDSTTSSVSYNTPARLALSMIQRQNNVCEEKRILYVAMTRAVDRLILTMEYPESNVKKDRIKKNPDNATKFSDWILACLCDSTSARNVPALQSDTSAIDTDAFLLVSHEKDLSWNYPIKSKITAADDSADEELVEKIKNKLSFKYKYADLDRIPSKVSVSDIKNGIFDFTDDISPKESDFDIPAFLSETASFSAAGKGTAMHTFMQYANYENASLSVMQEAKYLVEKKFITGEQYGMLDFEKLSMFFMSDLYCRIKNAYRVYREKRFTLRVPISAISEKYEGRTEQTVMQGVIDCFIVDENGKTTVIDYKTDKVGNMNSLVENYKIQIELYKKAVAEMTGNDEKNISAEIYSFYLGKSVSL